MYAPAAYQTSHTLYVRAARRCPELGCEAHQLFRPHRSSCDWLDDTEVLSATSIIVQRMETVFLRADVHNSIQLVILLHFILKELLSFDLVSVAGKRV
jgi:hypothetical protein